MEYSEFQNKLNYYRNKGETMSFEEFDETIKEMINVRGDQMAKFILIEELSELIQRLCKDLRDDTSDTQAKRIKNRNCILEELTDVENFLHAIKIIYNFSEDHIMAARIVKILRMQERILELRNKD